MSLVYLENRDGYSNVVKPRFYMKHRGNTSIICICTLGRTLSVYHPGGVKSDVATTYSECTTPNTIGL